MTTFLDIARSKDTLSEQEAYTLQKDILDNKLTTDELLELFAALDRPLSEDELFGFYRASREAMVPVSAGSGLLDTAGTGSDGLHTINISSIAAILLAALDVRVAKHGNRAATSKCGSADVLEALGIDIELDAAGVIRSIKETNFGFMFAPKFHPAFRHAGPARKAYGKRTYFNFLGPLLNPASADFRLVGIAEPKMMHLMGSTLMKAGVQKAWLVHGRDGMDEISTCAITDVSEFTPGKPVTTFTIDPTAHGLLLASPLDVRGGDKTENAHIARLILGDEGEEAHANAVILNVAAGLLIAGVVSDYTAGIERARQALKQKVGLQKLEEINKFRV